MDNHCDYDGIRRISIENFRGIDHLDLSFVGPNDYPTQVVVLGGPNGCGKTAVLEACLIAAGYGRRLDLNWEREAIRVGADDYRIRAEVQLHEQGTLVGECTSRGSDGSTAFCVPCLYFSSWRAPKLVGPVGVTAGNKEGQSKKEANRLERVKKFLANVAAREWFDTSSSAEGPASKAYSRAMDGLNRAWRMFYPGQSLTFEPAGDEADAGFDAFLTDSTGSRIPLDSLSSGQLELFAFAGELIMEKYEQMIIFVDEPELHLDPQWHRAVLKAILSLKPRSQLVVATHSPEIYDSVRSFERHFLVPADDPRAAMWEVDKTGQEVPE